MSECLTMQRMGTASQSPQKVFNPKIDNTRPTESTVQQKPWHRRCVCIPHARLPCGHPKQAPLNIDQHHAHMEKHDVWLPDDREASIQVDRSDGLLSGISLRPDRAMPQA